MLPKLPASARGPRRTRSALLSAPGQLPAPLRPDCRVRWRAHLIPSTCSPPTSTASRQRIARHLVSKCWRSPPWPSEIAKEPSHTSSHERASRERSLHVLADRASCARARPGAGQCQHSTAHHLRDPHRAASPESPRGIRPTRIRPTIDDSQDTGDAFTSRTSHTSTTMPQQTDMMDVPTGLRAILLLLLRLHLFLPTSSSTPVPPHLCLHLLGEALGLRTRALFPAVVGEDD